jgi:CzcA family heavy metal efflux pump
VIEYLLRFSLSYRSLVVTTALGLIVLGAYVSVNMPVDVFPDLTAPTVVVLTEAHGMAPTEVETLITFPIETAVNGAAGVRRVRSSSSVGISVVWVEFDWGTNIQTARQTVNEKLSLVQGGLPPQAGQPVLAPQASIMGEVLIIALRSDRHSMFQLRTAAETTLRRRLLAVEGVAQVTPLGGDLKQYQAILEPSRLQAYGVGTAAVAEALAATNENATGGIMVEGGQEFLVKGTGRVRQLEQIAETVVTVRKGVPIRVRELGSVEIGPALKRGVGSAMGEPAVVISVTKQPQVNTLELTQRLDATLDEIAASLPEGMEIQRDIFQQADFIQVSIDNIRRELRDGAILVVIIVILFLGNMRASLITLTSIPLSLLTAVLVLWAWGQSINTMTLGGMAIAIGALVDDAIVDVENVFRRLRENAQLPAENRRSAFRVILQASLEIRTSIVFATIIVVLVFLPLFFLPGIEGRLLIPLGVAYIVSMLASLMVAITVTPALCSYLLPKSRAIAKDHEPLLARLAKRAYRPLLDAVLDRPRLVAGGAAALLLAALATLPLLGQAFLPEFNEGALTVTAGTLPGTSLEESDQLGREVERILLEQPEVVAVARMTGRAELSEHVQGVESSELTASLDMHRAAEEGRSERTIEQLLEAIREELAVVPGMMIEVGQPISHRIDHMLSGTRAAIAINIFAPDEDPASLQRLRQLALLVQHEVEAVPGAVDVAVEQQMHVPTMNVDFDRHAIQRHGLRVRDVGMEVERAFAGETVSQILEGRNPFDLVVRVSRQGEVTEEEIRRLPVPTPAGATVPLGVLAHIRRDRSPNTISRENVQRKIVVSCNVAGRDIGSVIADIQSQVASGIDWNSPQYAGYYVQYGGQFESAQSAFRLLVVLGAGVVLFIGLLLHIALRSARDALLVLVNLPLALIGGIFAVLLSGGVLSLASLVGFITLLGIATRNGIMLVSHIRHLQREEGETEFRSAVHRGAMERLSPILMTALSTGLGLLPLALSGGHPGSEIQTPLAIVVVFGLLSSTLLNMVVVPALFLRWASPRPATVSSEENGAAIAV